MTDQERWIRTLDEDIRPKLLDWYNNPPAPKHKFLVLSGDVGTGKTELVKSLGLPISYFDEIVKTWNESEKQWSSELMCYPCGVIDDVWEFGKGNYGSSDKAVFQQIILDIDRKDHLRLIITTNLSAKQLKEFCITDKEFGNRVWDRLINHGKVIVFKGPSLRGSEHDQRGVKPRRVAKPEDVPRCPLKSHEVCYTTITNKVLRVSASMLAAKAADEKKPPFDRPFEEWPEWLVDWVTEGQTNAATYGESSNVVGQVLKEMWS